ncbi:MAG TPA: DoxX family protein [Pyrinomonadaceae bacterium]|nr:DoxX family protein [Pyrinomonadaceae bacterium]
MSAIDTLQRETNITAGHGSTKMLWAGRILSVLLGLFLVFDAVVKLVKPPFVVEVNAQLGYPEGVIVGLGVVLLVCTVLYLIPRTAILGAILLTGYLGGAVATHVRVGGPFSSIIFPIILGVLLWGALYLRDERLRSMLPGRRS